MLDGQRRVPPLSLIFLRYAYGPPISFPIFPPVGFSGIQAISTRLVPITTVFPLNGARAVDPKLCAKVPWETAVDSKGHYHCGYFVFEENSSTSHTM